MIAKQHRFHGYNKLTTVYRKGQTVRSSALSLKYYANPRSQSYRLAVVVSRKVHKSAVVRNRIRRRIFELYRQHSAAFVAPYDMIVTVFSEQIATTPAPELAALVERQLRQAGIIADDAAEELPKNDPRGIVKTKEG